jgi:hypothetical protein
MHIPRTPREKGPGKDGLGPAALTAFASIVVAILTIAYNIDAASRADVNKEKQRLVEQVERKNALRSAIRSELNQLIDILNAEIKLAEKPDRTWTWLPVHDFFGAYRRNLELFGTLTPEEVDKVTAAVHGYAEAMGYVFRENKDFSTDVFPGIGRNIRVNYGSSDKKEVFRRRLIFVKDTAEKAARAIVLADPKKGAERPEKSFVQER